MKIKSININAFRGIPNSLNLDLHGNSLLLLGENGTGKSSVIDAIEFFFTGKISHLMLSGPLALRENGPNTKNPDNASVNLVINPGNNSTTRTFCTNPNIPEDFQDYFNLAKNGKFILRRSQILNLINTTPSERYKFISTVIGSENLEQIGTAMFQAQKYCATDVEKINKKIEKIKTEIFENLEVNDENNILPTINQLLKKQDLGTIKSTEDIDNCIKKLDELSKSSDKELLGILNDILDNIEEIPINLDSINEELIESRKFKKEIIKHDPSELSLIKILKNSLEIIKHNTDECPLCKNEIESEILLKDINNRLEDLESLKKYNEKLKTSLKVINERLQFIRTNMDNISLKIDYFEELKEFNKSVELNKTNIDNFQKFVNINSFLQNEITIHELSDELKNLIIDIKLKSNDLFESIIPSEKDKKIETLYNLLYGVNKNLKKLDKKQEDLRVAKKHLLYSEIIYKEFSSIKKRKIQDLYDTIKDNVERYYSILHPHELYEDIKLGIDPNKKASTDLRMTIFGKEDQDPRALSSEGHLDSLGLCIFLALFKRVYKDFPLLVLDDVVTTMDSRHRENVCQLLFEEFGDKQFIITTHDSIWFEQLRVAQRVHNLHHKFKNLTIISWNEDYGPEIIPYKVRWEKIRELIDEGNKHCAGNEGRRYLEWLLKDICYRTRANIPSKQSQRYEIRDLLRPAKNRLLGLIKEEDYWNQVDASFKKLDRTIMMGNLLSHDNLMAGNVSINEVNRFCNSVHEIDELLKCSNCHAPLGYYGNLKILRCKNKKCRSPLEIKTN